MIATFTAHHLRNPREDASPRKIQIELASTLDSKWCRFRVKKKRREGTASGRALQPFEEDQTCLRGRQTHGEWFMFLEFSFGIFEVPFKSVAF